MEIALALRRFYSKAQAGSLKLRPADRPQKYFFLFLPSSEQEKMVWCGTMEGLHNISIDFQGTQKGLNFFTPTTMLTSYTAGFVQGGVIFMH